MTDHNPLTLSSPKQRQGGMFEEQACLFLQAQGLHLIAKNWQQPKVGELDLVMLEKGAAWSTLVFVEVRQRKRSGYGDAVLSITASKQQKIIKTARYFLQHYPKYRDCECRFDIIAYNTSTNDINSISPDNKHPHVPHRGSGPVITAPSDWIQGAFLANAW